MIGASKARETTATAMNESSWGQNAVTQNLYVDGNMTEGVGAENLLDVTRVGARRSIKQGSPLPESQKSVTSTVDGGQSFEYECEPSYLSLTRMSARRSIKQVSPLSESQMNMTSNVDGRQSLEYGCEPSYLSMTRPDARVSTKQDSPCQQ